MKFRPVVSGWILLLLAGCATAPPSPAWQETLGRLQEDIETRSLTGQLAAPDLEAVPVDLYGTGHTLYMDIYGKYYSYDSFSGGNPQHDYGYGPPSPPLASTALLYGGLYSQFGLDYFRGPAYYAGPAYRYGQPRVPPRPAAAPSTAPTRAGPNPRHPSHAPGPRRGRGKR